MKSKIVSFVVLFFVCVSIQAQVEVYGRYTSGGKVEPDINIFGTKEINNKINFTYFALLEKKWGESYIGISYSPKSWMSVGVGAGIEQNSALYRFGGSFWFGHERNSLLILWEKGDGTDNYWYKTVLSHRASDKLTFGAVAWRFHGVGPIVKYTPNKSNLTFWVLPVYDFEFKAKRLVLGVSRKI